MWDMIKNFFLFSSGVLQATTLLLIVIVLLYVRKTKRKTEILLVSWMIRITDTTGILSLGCPFVCFHVSHGTLRLSALILLAISTYVKIYTCILESLWKIQVLKETLRRQKSSRLSCSFLFVCSNDTRFEVSK